jgi:hypothetical protein
VKDSQGVRQFNIGKLIEVLRAQQRDGYSDEKLFDQVVGLFRELKVASTLQTGRIIAIKLLKQFELDGVELYTRKLIALGIQEETLFVAFLLFMFLPQIDKTLQTAFGDIKERRRKAEKLREAAALMDEFASSASGFLEATLRRSTLGKTLPMPRETADGLHIYANALFIREQLRDALDLNSGVELAKYTLAGAIHRITGKYHDREVSAVLGVFLRNLDYDETAHRVWRIRTFPRLNPTCAYLPIILHALNSVLSEPVGG